MSSADLAAPGAPQSAELCWDSCARVTICGRRGRASAAGLRAHVTHFQWRGLASALRSAGRHQLTVTSWICNYWWRCCLCCIRRAGRWVGWGRRSFRECSWLCWIHHRSHCHSASRDRTYQHYFDHFQVLANIPDSLNSINQTNFKSCSELTCLWQWFKVTQNYPNGGFSV